MTDDFAIALAPRAHRAVELLHSPVYFAPEAEAEFTAIGLRPGSMPYFASRSAPMGAVGAGVTAATFYNFNPAMVARHIPRAWTLALPEQVIEARWRVAAAVLRRLLGEAADSAEVGELAALTREATAGLAPAGRPLYAGHAALAWPDDPVLQLWHGATLLREYRGDGHVAVLLQSGLTGLEALVTHTVTGAGFTVDGAKRTRGWSVEEWDAACVALDGRGLLAGGALTEAGRALRERIEHETNRLAAAPWRRLGEERTTRLIELGKRFSRIVAGQRAFPPSLFAQAG
jgi:hypothetical protein